MLSQTSILKMLQLTSLIASNKHKRSNSKLKIIVMLRLKINLLKILRLKFKLQVEESKVQMRDFLLFQKLNMPREKSFMNNITVQPILEQVKIQ